MPKRTRIWLLVGILIIATFLRFYHLASTPPGLYPDEAMDGNNAAEVAQTGHFQVFYPEDNGREGLYVNILAVILKSFPIHDPWIIRLPAAVAGVLTVLGLYFLAAELFGYEVGLLAAFLLATSFWHINFSRIGFRAILSPLLLTWSFYFLIKSFHSHRPSLRTSSILFPILAGIIYSLGFYTYIAYRVTPLLLLLFIPFFKKYPGFWKRAILFLIVALIVAAPIGLYFLQNPGDFFGRASEISISASANPFQAFASNVWKTALMFNIHGDNNWRQNISGAPELFWPVGILFLVGIIVTLYTFVFRKKNPNFFDKQEADVRGKFSMFAFGAQLTLSWFVLGLLPEIFSDEGIPHALRSLLAVVPIMILAAIAGVWLYRLLEKHWSNILARPIAIIFLVIIATFGYVDYFIVWAKNPDVPAAFNADYVTIGHKINALPAGTPKYVIVPVANVFARGVPVPAETTMFITDTFTPSQQATKNIHYLLPNELGTIPAGTPSSTIFFLR